MAAGKRGPARASLVGRHQRCQAAERAAADIEGRSAAAKFSRPGRLKPAKATTAEIPAQPRNRRAVGSQRVKRNIFEADGGLSSSVIVYTQPERRLTC